MNYTLLSLAVLAMVGGGYCLIEQIENLSYFFVAYTLLQYLVLATAWNLLGGYAGYISFGTAACFGTGVYTAVVCIKAFNAYFWMLLLAGGVVSGLLGLGIGYLTRWLRGVSFSMATLALTVALQIVVGHWDYVGGGAGFDAIRPHEAPLFSHDVAFLFVVMALLAVLALVVAWWIEHSWVGSGLKAIRNHEATAASQGVPTLQLKLFASTASGGLMGMAGALFPYYMTYVEPSSAFNLDYAINSLAMPLIGGKTTWLGPVIGAILLGTVQEIATVAISKELYLISLGVVLFAFATLAPEGIIGLVQRVVKRKHV